MENNLKVQEPVFDPKCRHVQVMERTFTNVSKQEAILRSNVFLELVLSAGYDTLSCYASGWGKEFSGRQINNLSNYAFQNTRGRCSAESAPFFTLSGNDMHIDFAICTSGNYKVLLERDNRQTLLSISDPDEEFSTMLAPGETFAFPRILAHIYSDAAEGCRIRQEFLTRTLSPHPVYHRMPTIYNHWWAYEDRQICEEVILQNAAAAGRIGIEMLVLDAGWFGHDSLTEEWFRVRGDWENVNHSRFPHGLSWLRERLKELGLKMGIWCELEGLGPDSELLREHPEYAAVRDGENLGYVCFASPQVQEWAYQTMSRLFRECGSAYWKLDFNLDPGLGCNAPGHGHGQRDGLVRHYKGLYRVLDRIRADFPDLVIENCSSGGQRLNLEMAGHTHVHFLSDPDYSTHQMHQFKEASKWFLPKQLLHFMWSNTVCTNGGPPFGNLDLDALAPHEIAYHMRLAMMHQFGISHRLTEYSDRTLALIRTNLAQYKELIRPFVSDGRYLPLYLSEHINIFSFTRRADSLVLLFAEEAGEVYFDLSLLFYGILPSGTCRIQDPDYGTERKLTFPKDSIQTFSAEDKWTSRLMHLHFKL